MPGLPSLVALPDGGQTNADCAQAENNRDNDLRAKLRRRRVRGGISIGVELNEASIDRVIGEGHHVRKIENRVEIRYSTHVQGD